MGYSYGYTGSPSRRSTLLDLESRDSQFTRDLLACQDRLYAYAMSLLGRADLIEDIVQQTNLVLLRKADEFQPGTEFGAWACRIAFYEILKQRARYSRERNLFDDDLLGLMAEHAERQSETAPRRREALDECMRTLTTEQQQMVRARYEPGSSVQSMAEAMGRPVGSVSQALYRIRTTLAECVQRKMAEEAAS